MMNTQIVFLMMSAFSFLYFLFSFVVVSSPPSTPPYTSTPPFTSSISTDTLANFTKETRSPPPWDRWDDISIVLLWVNGSDPDYRKLRGKYRPSEVGGSRDRDSGELKHALRSLEKYMPWHKGTIFLVTPGQTPTWMNISHPRLKIIDQDDLLPDLGRVIPTFNSLVVEYFLAKIPDLTDTFLYMNDDMFFGQPVEPWHYFDDTGAPKIYFENYTFKTDPKLPTNQWWMRMVSKTSGLLDQRYGVHTRYRLKHVPIVYYRQLCQLVHRIWPNEIYDMLPHRFRDPNDVIFTFFHEYMLIHEGYKCCGLNYTLPTPEEKENARLYVVTDDDTAMQNLYQQILAKPPRFFTMNDAFNNASSGVLLDNFLHEMFPNPSSFELKQE